MSETAPAPQFPQHATGRPSGQGAMAAPGHRYNRACDSCHISKVRCVPEPLSPSGACKRCAKNGTPCMFSPVGPRRRPLRTKSDRIAELEKRVRDMQIRLEKQVEKSRPGEAAASDVDAMSSAGSSEVAPSTGSACERTPPGGSGGEAPGRKAAPDRPAHEDVVDRGILTVAAAGALVEIFRNKLQTQFLGFCLPKGSTASELRKSHPATWLSLLCAASGGSATYSTLAPVLFTEMKKVLDENITEDAQPNLDVLQSLHNYVFYYYDPVSPRQQELMKYHLTAVRMIVKMAEASAIHNVPEHVPITEEDVGEPDLEISRELLVWYWGSFVLAMKVRQPMILRYNHLIKTSLKILHTSCDHHDRCLVQWVKLAHATSETAILLMRVATQEPDGLTDKHRDTIVMMFEKKLQQWLLECPFDLLDEMLMVEYHSYILHISEVIYPAGKFQMADFQRRTQGLPPLNPVDPIEYPDQNYLAPFKIDYTAKCITAAHAILDIVINMEAESVRLLALIPYGRVFYALRFLLILAHSIWKNENYDLIDIDSLKLGHYVAELTRCLEDASDGGKYKLSTLWLYALKTRIGPWYKDLWSRVEAARPKKAKAAAKQAVEGQSTQSPAAMTVSSDGSGSSPGGDVPFQAAATDIPPAPAAAPGPAQAPTPLAFPFQALSPLFHYDDDDDVERTPIGVNPNVDPMEQARGAVPANAGNLDAWLDSMEIDPGNFDFDNFYDMLTSTNVSWSMSPLSPSRVGVVGSPPPPPAAPLGLGADGERPPGP